MDSIVYTGDQNVKYCHSIYRSHSMKARNFKLSLENTCPEIQLFVYTKKVGKHENDQLPCSLAATLKDTVVSVFLSLLKQ